MKLLFVIFILIISFAGCEKQTTTEPDNSTLCNPSGESVQCIATTQDGDRCKRMTTNKDCLCWQHD